MPRAASSARPSSFFFSPDLLILIILFLAFALRVLGIQFGLPHLYHADESNIVNRAVAFGLGDFNPHYFKVPPFLSYLLFGIYGFYYLAGHAAGFFPDIQSFKSLFLTDPTSFYLIARVFFGAFLGTAAIFIWFIAIRRFFSVSHAVLFSLFLALNFLHIRDAHFFYHDIPLSFILSLVFYFSFRLIAENRFRDDILLGCLIGLAVTTKYNGAFFVIPYLFARGYWFFQNRGDFFDFLKRSLAAGLCCLFVYSAGNPYAWLDSCQFLADFTAIRNFTGFTGWHHHFTYSLKEAMGWPLLLLGVGGVLRSFFVRDVFRFAVTFFLLSYYGVLVFSSQPYDRYVLLLVPGVLFFAADCLLSLSFFKNAAKAVQIVIVLGVLLPNLLKVYWLEGVFLRQDVRTAALEWTQKHLPAGSRIAVGEPFFLPRLKPSLLQLEEKKQDLLNAGDSAKAEKIDLLLSFARKDPSPRYNLFFLKSPEPEFVMMKPTIAYDFDVFKRERIEYVMVPKINSSIEPSFFKNLPARAKLISRFTPYYDTGIQWSPDPQPLTGAPATFEDLAKRRQNGQIIEIYELNR